MFKILCLIATLVIAAITPTSTAQMGCNVCTGEMMRLQVKNTSISAVLEDGLAKKHFSCEIVNCKYDSTRLDFVTIWEVKEGWFGNEAVNKNTLSGTMKPSERKTIVMNIGAENWVEIYIGGCKHFTYGK